MAAPATQPATNPPPVNPSSSTETYALNERVLCYHGPLVYEAKVLQMEDFKDPAPLTGVVGMHYFVHYKGWKRTWDEWVPQSRLLKLNEQNLAHQKALSATHASTSNTGGGSSGATSKSHKAGGGGGGGVSTAASSSVRTAVRKDGRGTKRARDDDDGARKPEMKLAVPEVLKQKLVDDWEAVTKKNQIVPLPRSPTVVEILHSFSEYVTKTKPSSLKDPQLLLQTILSGLQVYFDKSLGTNLLYRFERPQYAQVRKQYWTGQKVVIGTEKEMSEIYGAEHLLRMLVSLPQMVAQSSLDPESLSLVRDYSNELIQYMMLERERLFLKEYENPGPGYMNVSRS